MSLDHFLFNFIVVAVCLRQDSHTVVQAVLDTVHPSLILEFEAPALILQFWDYECEHHSGFQVNHIGIGHI